MAGNKLSKLSKLTSFNVHAEECRYRVKATSVAVPFRQASGGL
jgi:hypothetical protein